MTYTLEVVSIQPFFCSYIPSEAQGYCCSAPAQILPISLSYPCDLLPLDPTELWMCAYPTKTSSNHVAISHERLHRLE